jgi:hypothetical protein
MAHARARALRVDEDELAPPRRTITITGNPGARPQPRVIDLERRRAARAGVADLGPRAVRRAATERLGPRPDRLAMWALMMCLFLVVLVAISPHG